MLSIYLHIPFCTTKCTYCAFNTYTNLEALYEPFTQALIREAQWVGAAHARTPVPAPVWSVFFGGGTPSLLTAEQLGRVLTALRHSYTLTDDAEISMEANPNDMTDAEIVQAWRAVGINRLSIGMQSANARDLALFARRHDHAQVIRAVSNARAAGFDNLNLDLIYGIPQQTLAEWGETLAQALALQPEHISLYALGLEDGTPLADWVARGKVATPDDDLSADMYDMATAQLAAAGYTQYEISNWSKAGRQCRHNLQYWRNWPYVGLGPGAHGWAGGVRYATILSPQRYIKAMQQATDSEAAAQYPHTPATADPQIVTREDEIAETLMMTLRLTQEGLDRAAFRARFGVDVLALHGATLDKYAGYGLLEYDEARVRLTDKGRFLSNALFRELV
jgi:oxygen-independent coproporphyrinogen III oxidase